MAVIRHSLNKFPPVLRNRHIWIIAVLMVVFTISYYAEQIGIAWFPFGERFLANEYAHDVYRSLFLVPMVYTAIVFRFRGAILVSIIVFIIVLPRGIYYSPNPDPVLRPLVFIIVAGLAAIALGLERDRRIRETKALEDLLLSTDLLQASRTRYKDLFDSATDAIIIRDLKGNIFEVNKAATEITGYPARELINMNISDLLAAESLDIAMQMQQKQLAGETIGHRYELELVKKNGDIAIVDVAIRIITDNDEPIAVQATVRDITERKRLEDNMRFYLSEITKAQEEERKRIARELHDETAQDLAALLLELGAIMSRKQPIPNDISESLRDLRDNAERTMEGVRRFSQALRPRMLDELGLLASLEWLADDLSLNSGIKTRVGVSGNKRRLPPEVELVLFRIAQEALKNVEKHSRASSADVTVEFSEGRTRLTIRDNGKGFNMKGDRSELPRSGKLGLAGMEERTRIAGGNLTLHSEPSKGTVIEVEVPA
jgi:PAS domain S-box-containing protein